MKESIPTEQTNYPDRERFGVEHPEFFEKLPQLDVVIVPGAELKWAPQETVEQRELYDEGVVRAGIETKMRAIAAFELLRHGIVKNVIFTGGIMENEPFGRSLASVSREFALKLLAKENERREIEDRIPDSAIVVAADSKNSAEDVEEGLRVARDSFHAQSAYIATTGFHVPRVLITGEHLARQYGVTAGVRGIGAEDILRARSSHYEDLLGYFEFPTSVVRQPKLALKKGFREFVRRRVMMLFDPNDELGRSRAHKERSKSEDQK